MAFDWHQPWHGRVYAVKQVRPIFVEEDDETVVVTVYVYFSGEVGHDENHV
jgi:hypothetical protein